MGVPNWGDSPPVEAFTLPARYPWSNLLHSNSGERDRRRMLFVVPFTREYEKGG